MTLQTKIRRSVGAANTQCKSSKSITKGHGPQTYIIFNPCNIFVCFTWSFNLLVDSKEINVILLVK